MRRAKIEEGKICPKCGKTDNQIKTGYNRSGTQRCRCKECSTRYTINPKRREYPEETRKLAIKMYCGGIIGRGVGKILRMNKSNVMNRIKKAVQVRKEKTIEKGAKIAELDELYWFLERKSQIKTRRNVYIRKNNHEKDYAIAQTARLEYVNKQEMIEDGMDFRGIRLDIYLKDDANTVYDIEIQTTNEYNLERGSRYYQQKIDARTLRKGVDYSELTDSYVIFVCTFDYFHRGIAVYQKKSVIEDCT